MKLQQDVLDCGPIVIQALHKYYYDNWIPINKLKEKINLGLDGLNILELSELGKRYGLLLEAFEGDFNSLKGLEVEEPVISLINRDGNNHYVIITKIKNNKISYQDPIYGQINSGFSDFQKIFQNIIIIVSKTSYQLKKNKQTKKLFYVNSKTMLLTILLNIISLFFSFVSTFYIKIILDKIIPSAMFKGLNIVTLVFVFIAFLKISTTLFKTLIVKKIETRISFLYLNQYFNKLYYCSISKLEKISRSDHLRRIGTIQNISSFKANYIFTISSEITTFLFSTIILIWISSKIFLLVAGLSLLIVIISFVFQKMIDSKNKDVLNKNLDFSSKVIDLIYSQLEMKQISYRNLVQKNIDSSLNQNYKQNYKMFNLTTIHRTIIESIKLLIPFIIIYFATREIFLTNLSIGNMILFLSIFTFFINPLDSFTSLILNIPIIKQDIELLNFVLSFDEEEMNKGFKVKTIHQLSLNNLSFAYEMGKELFRINNLNIKDNLQIQGRNGCGKSTFLKVLSTYLVGNGKYNINDVSSSSYDVESLRENIYYSSNNTYLPNVTILQYLTNNEKEKIERLYNNINKYKLQFIFDSFGIKINDSIRNNGDNFSSGQKQFIILMPLLVNDYELILLDESFENIDKINFELLKKLIIKIHKNKLFIEISHSKKYLYEKGEIDFEKFNDSK